MITSKELQNILGTPNLAETCAGVIEIYFVCMDRIRPFHSVLTPPYPITTFHACSHPPRQIDVMVLYGRASLTSLGRISSAQMDTTVIESLATTNVAFANSEVAVYFNPVHVGPVRLIRRACSRAQGKNTFLDSKTRGRVFLKYMEMQASDSTLTHYVRF